MQVESGDDRPVESPTVALVPTAQPVATPLPVPSLEPGSTAGRDQPRRLSEPWLSRPELRLAGGIVGALIGAGVILGVLWKLWSRTATSGLVYTGHAIVPDQTEGFISSDGRFVLLTGATGILAAVLAWRFRTRRGPAVAAALALGAVVGARVTDLVGHWLGGGQGNGVLNTLLPRLPLSVHARGGLLVEAILALLVYVLLGLFAAADDLGVSDPADPPPPTDPALVGAPLLAQGARSHRDAVGRGHQQDLAPE